MMIRGVSWGRRRRFSRRSDNNGWAFGEASGRRSPEEDGGTSRTVEVVASRITRRSTRSPPEPLLLLLSGESIVSLSTWSGELLSIRNRTRKEGSRSPFLETVRHLIYRLKRCWETGWGRRAENGNFLQVLPFEGGRQAGRGGGNLASWGLGSFRIGFS